MEHVVVEAVLLVPQPLVVHGRGYVDEVLEELRGHVLVDGVMVGQCERHLKHRQAVRRHPCSAVGLLEHPARGEPGRPVEGADVVEPQEAPLEQIVAFPVLAVHPPGEVEEQLVEDALEKGDVLAAVDLEDAQCAPGVGGRVDVPERPLVSGQLPVRVHVPLATEQAQLVLGELWVDVGERDAVEGQIPGRVPGVLPGVRHGDDVTVAQVAPVGVAAHPASLRRRGLGRVAVEPSAHIQVVELLRPQHAGEGLP